MPEGRYEYPSVMVYVNGVPYRGGAFRVATDVKRVEGTENLPDPTWTHTDAQGHFHAWGGVLHGPNPEEWQTPTLHRFQVPCDGACGDPDHTESRWRCRLCGEEMTPARIARTVSRAVLTVVTAQVTAFATRDEPALPDGEVSLRIVIPHGTDPGRNVRELFGFAVPTTVSMSDGRAAIDYVFDGPLAER